MNVRDVQGITSGRKGEINRSNRIRRSVARGGGRILGAWRRMAVRPTKSGKHGRESISHKIQHLSHRPFAYLYFTARLAELILVTSPKISVYLWREQRIVLSPSLYISFSSKRSIARLYCSIDMRFSEHLKIFFCDDCKKNRIYRNH